MKHTEGESDDESLDADEVSEEGGWNESAHTAMLSNILSHSKRSKQRPEVITKAVAEAECFVGAANSDNVTAPLTVEDLLEATDLSKADRKGLAKLVQGATVCSYVLHCLTEKPLGNCTVALYNVNGLCK
jgi:hypothetical protein